MDKYKVLPKKNSIEELGEHRQNNSRILADYKISNNG